MRAFVAVLMLVPMLLAGCAETRPGDDVRSPYLDDAVSEVRGLSPEEIEELRSGAGMGMARPAELNGYPGPLHVLDLAEELGLSEGQRAEVEAIRAAMLDEAVPLGESILEAHAELEVAFRAREIDAEGLRTRLDSLADLYGELRFVHLAAHLDTAPVLTRHQTMQYMELRGYTDGAGHDPSHGGHD